MIVQHESDQFQTVHTCMQLLDLWVGIKLRVEKYLKFTSFVTLCADCISKTCATTWDDPRFLYIYIYIYIIYFLIWIFKNCHDLDLLFFYNSISCVVFLWWKVRNRRALVEISLCIKEGHEVQPHSYHAALTCWNTQWLLLCQKTPYSESDNYGTLQTELPCHGRRWQEWMLTARSHMC
jgi:hypothetical protein